MTPLAARSLASLLEQRTGQQLAPGRRWRLDTALQQILRKHGIASLDMLAARVARAGDKTLADEVVEALINHETSFYRDLPLFGALARDVLPALAARRGEAQRLRVWSAGCATGQEAYSLAIGFADDPRWRGWQLEIVATDISRAAIARARDGTYSQFEVQRGMPIRQLVDHFEEVGEDRWRIGAELRERIDFRVHNLLDPLPVRPFDLILCRNVLLYFAPARRVQVFARLAGLVACDGILMLGAGETVLGQTEAFVPDPLLKGFYRACARPWPRR